MYKIVFVSAEEVVTMIIELPKKFYKKEGRDKYVVVKNGLLEIHGLWNFEKLMIEITYFMKGKDRFFYCQRKVEPGKITIDHLFPVAFGGMSITNNLEPTCLHCNSTKSDMNFYEYQIWRTLCNIQEKKKFYHKMIAKKAKKKYEKSLMIGYNLPKKWVEYRYLNQIVQLVTIHNFNTDKFQKMLSFVEYYHKLPRTLVISKNNALLEGATAYEVAMILNLKIVPVTVLENVIVFFEN